MTACGRVTRAISRRPCAALVMRFTTSCESVASTVSAGKGNASALATTTSTPGCLARHAFTKGSEGSAARTFVGPSRSTSRVVSAQVRTRRRGRSSRARSREAEQRRRERNAVATDVPVIGFGCRAEGFPLGIGNQATQPAQPGRTGASSSRYRSRRPAPARLRRATVALVRALGRSDSHRP